MRKKAELSTDLSRIVLFMDITHLRWAHNRSEAQLFIIDPIQAINDVAMEEGLEFGSIVAFTYYFEWTTKKFMLGYNRIDHPSILLALKMLLDAYYPKGERRAGAGLIPPHG